jgi:hypothetical protein
MFQECYASHYFAECNETEKTNILISGPAVTQTHNAPYYGAVTEHQGSPGIGNFAGSGIN